MWSLGARAPFFALGDARKHLKVVDGKNDGRDERAEDKQHSPNLASENGVPVPWQRGPRATTNAVRGFVVDGERPPPTGKRADVAVHDRPVGPNQPRGRPILPHRPPPKLALGGGEVGHVDGKGVRGKKLSGSEARASARSGAEHGGVPVLVPKGALGRARPKVVELSFGLPAPRASIGRRNAIGKKTGRGP